MAGVPEEEEVGRGGRGEEEGRERGGETGIKKKIKRLIWKKVEVRKSYLQ